MKQCPICSRVYADETLNFCLDDGATLVRGLVVDEPATVLLRKAVTSGEDPTRTYREPAAAGDRRDVRAGADATDPSRKRLYIRAGLVILAVAIAFVGFRFLPGGSSARQIESIAVLPLANNGGNAELEYVSDGIAESLTSSLSRVPDLAVKARSSVFRYKESNVDLTTIGRELGVQAILTGRIIQRGEQIMLSLELVDAHTGDQIWGKQYNRHQTDLLALQSDIARDVSRELGAKLSRAEEQRVARNYTANTQAYELYLKGRHHFIKITRPETEKAVAYFQQAIELDPSYALAYAGLADAYRALAIAGEMQPAEYLPKAKAAAQKAIEIDENLAEAHAVLGFITFWYDWDWAESEKHLKRAMELDPNLGDAHIFYANLLSNLGRHDEALAAASRARELDPLNTRTNALEGQFLLHAGRADEALVRLRNNLELDPNHWLTHFFITSAYIEKGMFAEAIDQARRAREIYESPRSVSFLGYALAKSGRKAEARAELDELLQMRRERYVSPYNVAMIHVGLDDREAALEWLERGLQIRDPRLTFLKVEPKWHHLHGDARFAEILSKVGLR